MLAQALATDEPYCCRHRIIDARQRVRTVVTIGQGTLDEHGAVTDVYGYFVDITDAQRAATEADIDLAVAASAATRADIEQAKGALMLVHGITAVDAFAVLRWHSQQANIKLRSLASDDHRGHFNANGRGNAEPEDQQAAGRGGARLPRSLAESLYSGCWQPEPVEIVTMPPPAQWGRAPSAAVADDNDAI